MIIRVIDPSHPGDARRRAAIIAEELALDERARGAIPIIVTEIATNVLKHAGSGTIVIQPLTRGSGRGIRILGLDRGPGIGDIPRALEDGHSTAGTGGNGLGAIRRLSDSFEIHSMAGVGTAVMADVWHDRVIPPDRSPIEVGGISVPIRGEEVCGDGWGFRDTADSTLIMVVDGLGHGALAADAAMAAERVFCGSTSPSPAAILQDAHGALRATRGAAMAVAALTTSRSLISFAGIGNIVATVLEPEGSRGIASHNGIVGHQVTKFQEFQAGWTETSLLVMHSDGLNTRWDLKGYVGIWSKHPALIAGVLFRDFARERDDVTVVVARSRREAGGP